MQPEETKKKKNKEPPDINNNNNSNIVNNKSEINTSKKISKDDYNALASPNAFVAVGGDASANNRRKKLKVDVISVPPATTTDINGTTKKRGELTGSVEKPKKRVPNIDLEDFDEGGGDEDFVIKKKKTKKWLRKLIVEKNC